MITIIFRPLILCLLMISISSSTSVAQTDSQSESQNTTNTSFAPQDLIESYTEIRDQLQKYGLKEALPAKEGTFRLTTYNIENLFDDQDDPALSGREEDAEATKPEHQMIATAMAIRAVNPDILCLQEVESKQALLWYRDTYLADMGYDYVVSIDAGNARGIENSVLSRFPIVNSNNWPNKELGGVHPDLYGTKPNWHAGEPIAFRRSPLMVDIEIPAQADQPAWLLTLFVVHHKSGRFNAYWRDAEATGVLELMDSVLKESPERSIVVLGDFNAEVNDDSVMAYLGSGYEDIFAHQAKGKDIISHESGRRIDLFLGNKSALKRVNTNTAFVYGTAARPEGTTWRDLETFDGYAADHYPVSVDISN